MAQQIEDIKQELMDAKATIAALDGLTSTSQVSIFGNIFYVQAVEISILQQLIDVFISQIETIIDEQAVGSSLWLRAKTLGFQYGDSVELDTTNFSIAYPTEDLAKQIITRCSVKEKGNRVVDIKVAKSDPPVPLITAEQDALGDYLNVIKPAGTQINILSVNPDRLYVVGTVYFSGQFSADIQTNVEAALTAYMTNLSSATSFDGTAKVIDIINAIKGVEGVTDVNLSELGGRAQTTVFASRDIFYRLSTGVNLREYPTYAGYIIEEDDSGHTFADTLTYVAV